MMKEEVLVLAGREKWESDGRASDDSYAMAERELDLSILSFLE